MCMTDCCFSDLYGSLGDRVNDWWKAWTDEIELCVLQMHRSIKLMTVKSKGNAWILWANHKEAAWICWEMNDVIRLIEKRELADFLITKHLVFGSLGSLWLFEWNCRYGWSDFGNPFGLHWNTVSKLVWPFISLGICNVHRIVLKFTLCRVCYDHLHY